MSTFIQPPENMSWCVYDYILGDKISSGLSLSKFKILSGSTLKLIAIITMLIDHTAVIFANDFPTLFLTPLLELGSHTITLYYIMRKIGRFAFPIFCFRINI
jgi:hypothetical protein